MLEYIKAIAELITSIASLLGVLIALTEIRRKKKKTQPKHKKR